MSGRVMVGMSGGVDSSVAAYLLQQQGYEVIGVTLQLHNSKDSSDLNDAIKVSQTLGIEHHYFDHSELFSQKVISYFIDEYIHGRTPNPCVYCNRNIKFELLLQIADKLGCDYIVTGHYANIIYNESTDRYCINSTGAPKDQSYVLYSLSQRQLSRILFPLAGYDKQTIRSIAEKIGLDTASKPDSQEICFIPNDIDYADFIDKHIDRPIPIGNFIDIDGNVLGQHKGITRYTVGQRKGLGIAFGKPMFVLKILSDTNEIILGESGMEYSKSLIADKINLVALDNLDEPIHCNAKVRYLAKPSPCTVTPLGNDQIKVEFDEPQRAVTPGQSVVLYDGNTILGGGRIISTD